jgi:hypothetical protein
MEHLKVGGVLSSIWISPRSNSEGAFTKMKKVTTSGFVAILLGSVLGCFASAAAAQPLSPQIDSAPSSFLNLVRAAEAN